jgi:serine/threonine protein phosphatase 1
MAIWVIGDVHGQASLLDHLLKRLPRQTGDTTVFLGDYIDRGPDSRAVVNHLLAELDTGAIALWGNHEDMAAAAYGLPHPGKLDPEFARTLWLFPPNGGPSTLASFKTLFPGACPPALAALFPHLRPHWTDPISGIEFVHAYAPPGESLSAIAAQEPTLDPDLAGAARLLWETPGKEESGDPGRLVIVGHTRLDSGVPERRGHHLLIDTNAARGGPLTAICLVGNPDDGDLVLDGYQTFPDGSFRRIREGVAGGWVVARLSNAENTLLYEDF